LLRRLLQQTALLTLALLAGPALAASHALILWIGDYGRSDLNLPGIDIDARNARQIAQLMGVPAQNIREVSNRQLTRPALAAEFAALQQRMAEGDRVFVYYSGHGHQIDGVGGARCTEALVLQGPALFADFDLQEALQRLGRKAGQVVVMNDSCFSGGAATRSAAPGAAGDFVAKYFPQPVGDSRQLPPGYECGEAVNKMLRSVDTLAAKSGGPQVLYIAASNDAEVAYATGAGSLATNAWLACLRGNRADTNQSGSVSGAELQACAQRFIDATPGMRQTITLLGNPNLPLSLVAQAPAAPQPAPLNPAQALLDLQAGAGRDYQVRLEASAPSLRIRADFLDLTVTTNREGYLYLLQVGSDGRTFNLLFPNRLDGANFVSAGTHRLPRPNWRVRAGGPVGTSHLMAIVSPVPKDFSKGMDTSSVFASTPVSEASYRTLYVEAAGVAGGDSRYGASNLVSVQETP
jgi:hypothetical protein